MLQAEAAAPRPVEREGLAVHSDLMGRDVSYSVIVPEGAAGERFPVLYLLHGIGGDHSSWLEYTDLAGMMQRGEIDPMVVVMPDGYLSYYADAADGSLPYESFFISELMPEIDRRFPVLAGRRNCMIGGFSMGGFGALTLGLRNRDRFSAVIALSPSMRTDSVYASEGPQDEWEKQWGRTFGGVGLTGADRITPYYRARAPYHIIDTIAPAELADMTIIVDIGDRENSLAASSEQFHRRMMERGIPHTYCVRGGGHDFDCWNEGLAGALGMLRRGNVAPAALCEESVAAPAPAAVCSSELFLPVANPVSSRKYPVVYLRGDFTEGQRAELARRAAVMSAEGKIRPLALCFLSPSDSIAAIEAAAPALRASRRMRALVEVGTDASCVARDISAEPTYTAVVLSQPAGGGVLPAEFAERMRRHSRYPRLWLSQTPDNAGFGFASDLHVALRELGLSHMYRVEPDADTVLSSWKEWLQFIDGRFHI